MVKDYCLFCDKNNSEKHKIICENSLFYSRWDNFPVSKGHAEVIPKKHIESFFDLKNNELIKLFDLLKKTTDIIQNKYNPDGYNIGINEGKEAGRTIHHLHIHIIPRYKGDVRNPRGGIRHIIPGKGNY
jgi:diadenosine tetraphosphate (Ap4A) HIT family hydrolase